MPGVGAGPADAGGWLVRRNVANFARYAEFAAKHLGDRVRWWLTINEPTVYAKNAFVSGRWPPCRTGDWIAAWRALRNMNRGHRLAYDILHHYRSDALVGFRARRPSGGAARPGAHARSDGRTVA